MKLDLPNDEFFNLRIKIREKADETGWIAIEVPECISPDGILEVPKIPFMHWSLNNQRGSKHLIPDWTPISPSGIKMQNDSRVHTDWMLGAGLKPTDMILYMGNPYAKELKDAIYEKSFQIQEEICDFKCHVLIPGYYVSGEVFIPKSYDDIPNKKTITIIPNCNPKWLDIVLKTFDLHGGVITENGGEMAHLVSVCREKYGPMVRIPNARKIYPENFHVEINPMLGTVSIMDDLYNKDHNIKNTLGKYHKSEDEKPEPSSPEYFIAISP